MSRHQRGANQRCIGSERTDDERLSLHRNVAQLVHRPDVEKASRLESSEIERDVEVGGSRYERPLVVAQKGERLIERFRATDLEARYRRSHRTALGVASVIA